MQIAINRIKVLLQITFVRIFLFLLDTSMV